MKRICDFFSQEELDEIQKGVEKAESLTSGEVKVTIRCECEENLSPREQALKDFYQYGLDKTKGQTGILILVLLQERKVEVLGDKGINDKVPPGYWDEVAKMIVGGFRGGRRREGICEAVLEVGKLLHDKFPRQPDDVNELPDEVVQK